MSEILKDERNWAPYGGVESNVGTFLNQQSHPVAALSEKIVNSIDALLLAECKKRGINLESAKAPRSMQEAVEEFFGIKDCDISVYPDQRKNISLYH